MGASSLGLPIRLIADIGIGYRQSRPSAIGNRGARPTECNRRIARCSCRGSPRYRVIARSCVGHGSHRCPLLLAMVMDIHLRLPHSLLTPSVPCIPYLSSVFFHFSFLVSFSFVPRLFRVLFLYFPLSVCSLLLLFPLLLFPLLLFSLILRKYESAIVQ